MKLCVFFLFLSSICWSQADSTSKFTPLFGGESPVFPIDSITSEPIINETLLGSWTYFDMKDIPEQFKTAIEKNQSRLEFKFMVDHSMLWYDGKDTAHVYWNLVQKNDKSPYTLFVYQPLDDKDLHAAPATLVITKIKKKKLFFRMTYDAIEELKEPFTIIFKRKTLS